jgi:hypothetical protein
MRVLIPTLSFVFALLFLNNCTLEEPELGSRQGDSLFFSGRWWTIKKYEDITWGPGPNYFSANPNHVWVDEKDRLHMTISPFDGKWFATEIISADTMGYGTYRFTILGDFVNMPENVTLGLFTWDDNTFYEAGNSEVDIELSKWGVDSTIQTINYAVQPVAFGPVYEERHHNPIIDNPEILNGLTTHEFTWLPNKISWRSYEGEKPDEAKLISSWEFDNTNQARVKNENGNSSEPIVIPKPGETTNTRINYWLQTYISRSPTDGQAQEIMVTNFEYQSW